MPRGDWEVEAEVLGQELCDSSAVPEAVEVGLPVGAAESVGEGEALEDPLGAPEAVNGVALRGGERDTVLVPLTVGLSGGAAVTVPVRDCVPEERGDALTGPVGLWLGVRGEVGEWQGEGEGVPVARGEVEPVAVALGEDCMLPVPVTLAVAQLELLAPRPRDGVAEAECRALPLSAPVIEGEPDVLGLPEEEEEALVEGLWDGVPRMEAEFEGVAAAVPDLLREGEREEDWQGEAVVEAVPAARDALAEESGAEALGLPDWLTDALSRALAEGERVGSRGVALAGRVGSAV